MHVRRATSAEELQACLAIRRAVFIDEQNVPEQEELDELDAVCRHFLATPGKSSPLKEAIGTARILFLDDGTAKAQRVAVVKTQRQHGVGSALMFAVEGEAARAGLSVMILSSQVSAIPFYERLGYEAYGDLFVDAGIDHRMMRKNIL
ncbi:MAG TPA: GNAT family N-acetyltransferase [Myxococcota bacterium]|jgi:predicted GNAT family N-acyltransferase